MTATSPARPPITAPGAPRPAVPVRLVAVDVDGTLLDLDQRLHPRARAAVRSAVSAGTTVVLATGRMYRSVLPWALDLGIRAPLICYQGAMVRAMPGPGAPVRDGVPQGETLAEDPVAPAIGVRALEVARAGGWHVQAYRDDRLLCEQARPEAELYSRIAQVRYELVADLRPEMEAGSTKVVCVVPEEEGALRCQAALLEALGDAARVVRSLPQFVELTNPTAAKGRALRAVCERLGVTVADAVAVGDAPNDVDMLATAGFGVAVRTAAAEVLGAADAVCPPPQEGGVADVLEALGLVPG